MAFRTGNEAGHLNPATFSHARGEILSRFWQHVLPLHLPTIGRGIRTLSIVAKRYTTSAVPPMRSICSPGLRAGSVLDALCALDRVCAVTRSVLLLTLGSLFKFPAVPREASQSLLLPTDPTWPKCFGPIDPISVQLQSKTDHFPGGFW